MSFLLPEFCDLWEERPPFLSSVKVRIFLVDGSANETVLYGYLCQSPESGNLIHFKQMSYHHQPVQIVSWSWVVLYRDIDIQAVTYAEHPAWFIWNNLIGRPGYQYR